MSITNLRGVRCAVERTNNQLPAGRALAIDPLMPTDPQQPSIAKELIAHSWPNETRAQLAEWEEAIFSHQMRNPGFFVDSSGTRYELTDEGILRSPFPTDLIHVTPATPPHAADQYFGPNPVAPWLEHLHARLAKEVDKIDTWPLELDPSYVRPGPISNVSGEFSTESVLGIKGHRTSRSGRQARMGATILALDIDYEARSDNDTRYPWKRLSYLIPLEAVVAVELEKIYGGSRTATDATGPEGKLESVAARVLFSDGWRICAGHLTFGSTSDQPDPRLPAFTLCKRVAATRGAVSSLQAPEDVHLLELASKPSSDDFTEATPYDKGKRSRWYRIATYTFPGAKHFGIPSEMVDHSGFSESADDVTDWESLGSLPDTWKKEAQQHRASIAQLEKEANMSTTELVGELAKTSVTATLQTMAVPAGLALVGVLMMMMGVTGVGAGLICFAAAYLLVGRDVRESARSLNPIEVILGLLTPQGLLGAALALLGLWLIF